MKEANVRGEATSIPLGNVAPLLLPWTQDPWGMERPPLSVDAMRLSVELASATYHMSVDQWMQAGWRDVTIQVDGALTTGFEEPEDLTPVARIANALKLHHIRARLKQRNPLGQVFGAIRQIEKSDTGKVLVMAHPTGDGRYVIAISFMGTGSRFYDWFSNFRMNSENGFHKGFLQLAQQFEDNEDSVSFPDTARELGLEKLTLTQILKEAQMPGSRFILWLTGHSQGGALMQVYAYHKLAEGVLHRNMIGYGFASPSVVEGTAIAEPARFPLWHIINSDDLVPRMGAQMHLGVCLIYPAGEELRRKCYSWPTDEEAVRNRAAIEPLVHEMVDTPSCIEAAVAYLSELANHSAEDMIAGIGIMDLSHLPVKRFMSAADQRIDDLIRYIRRHAAAAYASITGESMDTGRVADKQARIKQVIDVIGVKGFSNALMQLMAYPHAINPRKGAFIGAYPYITLFGTDKLHPAVWRSGHPPVLVMAEDGRSAIEPDTAVTAIMPQVSTGHMIRQRVVRQGRTYTQRRQYIDTRHHTPLLNPGSIRPGEKLVMPKAQKK